MSEYDLDTTPARFGGSLRFLHVRVRIRIRGDKRFAGAGLHVRLGSNFTTFQAGRWSLRDIRLRGRRRLLGYGRGE